MTLREALTQAKPVVPDLCGRRRTLTSLNRPEVQGVHPISRITIWDDFCMKTLNDEYGPLLDREMSMSACASVPEPDSELFDIKIRKFTDIAHLIQWNEKIVNATLSLAKDERELCPGLGLRTQAAEPNISSSSSGFYNAQGEEINVDHWIALDDMPLQHLVVGMAWPSSMIETHKVFYGVKEPGDIECRPLQQLAWVCEQAKTRYGYIITDSDLLVCRFFKTPSGDKFEVSLMLVPWSTSGSYLTTDLAIWWLCMKALTEEKEDREIQRAAE
ncbi:hypothetical protein EV127DRAFT_345214 [Xylaria flabelliformis]|nr:hypothetical protein EV127DRAFT_345214 [Xylaria flabelliformis]